MAIFDEKIEIRERCIPKRCKGVHCVDLGESFPTSIYLEKSASIQPRTSPPNFRFSFPSRQFISYMYPIAPRLPPFLPQPPFPHSRIRKRRISPLAKFCNRGFGPQTSETREILWDLDSDVCARRNLNAMPHETEKQAGRALQRLRGWLLSLGVQPMFILSPR